NCREALVSYHLYDTPLSVRNTPRHNMPCWEKRKSYAGRTVTKQVTNGESGGRFWQSSRSCAGRRAHGASKNHTIHPSWRALSLASFQARSRKSAWVIWASLSSFAGKFLAKS